MGILGLGGGRWISTLTRQHLMTTQVENKTLGFVHHLNSKHRKIG